MSDKQGKYHVLTPKTDIGESIYFEAIDFALRDASVHNVAISGPYGAGKSSIIHSYINKRKTDKTGIVEDRYQINDITISLANIKATPYQSARNSVNIVEYAILEQLFFHKSCDKLPHSQFSRIKCLSNWDLLAYVSYIIVCFAFVFFWYNQRNLNIEIPGYLAWLVFSVLLGGILYKIFPIIRNLSIRKISLATASIEVNDGKGQSILNKHIDEILYFFQQTNTNVVIFEDLDRFDNPDLFVKLREINYLINNSESIEHNVVFIYALRDDVFQNKLRTKFFDFIVPIIPYVDGSNAVDKLYAKLKNEGISTELCDILSYYVGDMRMVHNIINEFQIYKAFKSTEADFDINKLLAIVAYKNCYPKDFADLLEYKGILYDVMQSKDCIVKQYREDLHAKISDLERKVERIIECQNLDIQALRIMYLNAILNSITQYKAISFSENNVPVKIDYMAGDETFNRIKTANIVQYCYYVSSYNNITYRNHSYIFKDIENIVDPSQSYQEKENAILERDTIDDVEEKLHSYQRELLILEQKSYKNLLNEGVSIKNLDLKNHLKIDLQDKQLELIEDLLACGFLNENYKMYLSRFHDDGTIGPEEQRFLIDVMRHKRNDYEYKLDRAEQLLKRIDDIYFSQTSAVWNYDLIDALMIAEGSTQKREYLFDLLMDIDGGLVFINEYVKHGKQVRIFIFELCDKHPELWKELRRCRNIILDEKLWVDLILMFARLDQIPKVFNENESIISEDENYFLRTNVSKERLYEVVRLLHIKFNKIHFSTSNEDKEFVIQNKAYVISKDVLENLIPFDYSKEQFECCNYGFLHNQSLESVLTYVKENISTYINELWFKLPIQIDSEEYIRKLLLCCKIQKIDSKEIIKHTNICIQDIGTIINDELELEPFFELEKVEPTWNNIKLVYEHCDGKLPNYLVKYLNKSHVYTVLHGSLHINLEPKDKTIEDQLFRAIFYHKELQASSLAALLAPTTILRKWDSSLLSLEKVEKLIEGRKVATSLQTYNFLRLEYKLTNITLLKNNFADVVRNFDSTVSFSSEEIDKLSNVNLHTLQYKKLLPFINPDAIKGATKLHFIVASLERRDPLVNVDMAIAVILNKNVDHQKRLGVFLSYIDSISFDLIATCLLSFDKPYSNIPKNYAKIPKGDFNIKLLEALKEREYISSYSIKKDNFWVYLRKSRIE